MEISPVSNINLTSVQNFLASKDVTDKDKVNFLIKNSTEIKRIITDKEFKGIMKDRPLIKFRPLKNSFTKRGDKILLAMALGIEPNDVDDYVDDFYYNTLENNHKELKEIDEDRVNKIKTYTFRHGKKKQVLQALDYELSNAKNKLQVLYRTLEYNSGGIADYFSRPIHRLDNATIVDLYTIIDSHLNDMAKTGSITQADRDETSQWALIQIYNIQNNQRIRNAFKLYKKIE